MDGLPLTSREPARSATPGLPPVAVDPERRRVHVLEIELPLRGETGPLVPRAERFTHFTLDRRTAELLEKLATAIRLREPCLLEGETSTSKTSSIEYLASVTGTPVSRINLSGQTDTSELIGRYVPNDGRLEASFDSLLRDAEHLTEASRTIVERARRQGRGLSLLESQKVAATEGIDVPEWRWQDGAVPVAMREGRWLILDELNLGEPQVLERLNPVLERPPSLVLTEGDGTVLGAGGSPVHDGFRVFATMNPAEYAGRSPLSPAYKDRFTAYKYVSPPTETEYAEMLALMVYGEQPAFSLRGLAYGGQRVTPLFGRLGRVVGVRGFLPKLAKLHATLEGFARRREIGRDGRERLAFTRRTLIELLGYAEKVEVVDRRTEETRSFEEAPKELLQRAIRYFYLDRIANEEDLHKVEDQLDAIGISERQWLHDLAAPAARMEPQIVPNVAGGTILLTPRRELGGFRVGEALRLREDAPAQLRHALGGGTRFTVAGVSPDGRLVVRIGEGACFKETPERIGEWFTRALSGA
jgi:MoxR-like ATPase